MAETIANYIHGYWDGTCSGGVWWSSAKAYKNAITNELFLELTAGLHNAIPGDTTYLGWANAEWSWFNASGMINGSYLVNDGLTSSCANNGETTWTYNQGVILGGLAQLYKATGTASLLTEANAIARAAIVTLNNGYGVLVEPCEPSSCDGDEWAFKGIFAYNLKYLSQVENTTGYASFFENQALSIEANDTNSSNQLGLQWTGPINTLTSGTQAAALDALIGELGDGSSGTVFSGVSHNLCLDVRGASNAAGTPIQIYTCNSTVAQSWTVVAAGSTLQSLGACLTDSGGGTTNGTPIVLDPCNGAATQVWEPQSNGALLNPATGKCVDDPGATSTSGTALQLYTCNQTNAQDWSIP
jgi:hypothetical protein